MNTILNEIMKFKSIISLFFALLLSSCDPTYNIGISNESDDGIILQITFNENPPNPYGVKYFTTVNSNKTPLVVDTLSNMCRYAIAPKEYFLLWQRIDKAPDFSEFKELIIVTKTDTTMFNGKENIEKAFHHSETNRWELVIK